MIFVTFGTFETSKVAFSIQPAKGRYRAARGAKKYEYRGDIKYYFADFVHKGGTPPLRTNILVKKELQT